MLKGRSACCDVRACREGLRLATPWVATARLVDDHGGCHLSPRGKVEPNTAQGPLPVAQGRRAVPRLADEGGQANGRFWLPGSVDETLPGRLDVSRRWSRVEILGEITPSLELIGVSEDGSTTWGPTASGEERDLIVHGQLLGGYGKVTLVDAQTRRRRSNLFGSLAEQIVEGRYALLGGLVGSAEHRFDAARVRLHNLDQWVRLTGLSVRMSESFQEVHIDYEAPNSIKVAVPGLGASLEFEASWTPPNPTLSGASITTQTWLVWKVPTGQTVEGILTGVVGSMSALLTILFNEDCPPLELRVHDPEADLWLDVYSPALGTVAPIASGNPLLLLEEFGLAALTSWIEQFADLSPLPQLIAGAVTSPDRTVQNKLLELAAAAEGLHRRLHRDQRRYPQQQVDEGARLLTALGDDEDLGLAVAALVQDRLQGDGTDDPLPEPRLRPDIAAMLGQALAQYLWEPSYPQRLAALLQDVDVAAPGVAGWQNRWKGAVVDARIGFAHSLESDPAEDDILGWHVLAQSLRWLLTARLLLHAGVGAGTLSKAFKEYDTYSNFLRLARKTLPRVYG